MQLEQVVEPSELLIPGEVFSVAEAAELGRKIGTSWQKTTRHILETAELCEAAYRRYASHGLSVVLRSAQMSKPTFMKLAVIGRDQRLPRIQELLPPGFSIIYAVSQLSDEALNEAVKAGVIHPHARRAEIEALRKQGGSKNKGSAADEPPAAVKEITAGGRYEFIVPKNIGAGACAQMRQILHRLHTKFGVEMVSIKELQAVSEPVVTPAVPSGPGVSPVNRPTVRTQPIADRSV